ncbi:hypothetical protein [Paraburkholderia diazotrophica]|uniref:Uncharacterized protein n=1 Tax=Paraburkholderia diazotrophica TaxID=667676 RepID=A0A1H7EIB0_9BURK|nr:hypothetical protein [Paraburkholderia diazotrophica]SEK12807.1 hypothetical protein SAMN05192539_106028 [Paraburkholderia diazotrophica]
MTQQKSSTTVGKMFIRCAQSAVAGAAVSYAANHYAVVPMLHSLAQAALHHEAFASAGVGERLFAVLAVAAVLFAASIATERRRNAFHDAVASCCRRVVRWLMAGAAAKVCFLCGALAGFGGWGWLAGLLTLAMYAGIFVCIRGLVVFAQTPPRTRSH